MLRSLHIRDYALIEALEVEFDSGLNIITGETGAGKSILLGALGLILGERASTEAVRAGAKKAVIEGLFDDANEGGLPDLLRSHEIEPFPSGALVVRREVSASHSRAFVNDTPATLAVLRAVAQHVIDLHGQHEHQSLLRTETHLSLLDDFGGLGGLVDAYRAPFEEVARLQRKRADLVRREAELQQQKTLFAFQIDEIDGVAPEADEEEALDAERRILENAETLYEATASLYELLYESEDAIYDRLVVVRNGLRDLARIDETFEATLAEMQAAEIAVEEATKFLQGYNARIEFNPERLEGIRERLGALEGLKRKYGGSLDAVLDHRKEIGATYDLAADFEGSIARIDGQIAEAQAALSEAAYRLSQKRHEVAERIEQMIQHELADLGMPHGQFVVDFSREPDANGWIAWPDGKDTVRLRALPTGADLVEFYITTNVGEAPRPLVKVASGGEVSRIMLALKTILAKSERLPILVFDEIDVGISGEVARRVGESMQRLGAYHQIIAITHLPQIAALGDHHFLVEKHVEDDPEGARTKTTIRRLADEERTREVAALTSGEALSEAALESARELISAGKRSG
ncbi:MAG: DNA repair protein RecN [Bacteroidota bacterium]